MASATARRWRRSSTNKEATLLELQAELLDGGYRPGPYRHFWIRDPKRQKISAAPFRDRVVHHALCQVTGPLLSVRNLGT